MEEQRFTAPFTGWYHLAPGRTPEYLGTEKPVISPEGSVTARHMLEGDTLMNSGGTLTPAGEPSLVIPWGRK